LQETAQDTLIEKVQRYPTTNSPQRIQYVQITRQYRIL